MKASKHLTRWASLAEARALVIIGWRILSYGTAGADEKCVLLTLGV